MMTYSIRILFGLSLGLLVAAGGASAEEPYDDLGPVQSLDRLQNDIERLDRIGKAIQANAAAAEENRGELKSLEAEKTKLDAIEADYSTRASRHNQDADAYNTACTAPGLAQAEFNQCLARKADLDFTARTLGADKRKLAGQFAAYNTRVEDFNARETARATAAAALSRRYDETSADIRALQLHLNVLGVTEGGTSFAAENSKCTGLADLEKMHGCMVAIWKGGKKP